MSNQKPDTADAQPEEDTKVKELPKSRDDEDKEWNFQHLEKILAELPYEKSTVGNVLAAMVYQVANHRPTTEDV